MPSSEFGVQVFLFQATMPAVTFHWLQQAHSIRKNSPQTSTLQGPSRRLISFTPMLLQWHLKHAFVVPLMAVDWVCILPSFMSACTCTSWQCLPIGPLHCVQRCLRRAHVTMGGTCAMITKMPCARICVAWCSTSTSFGTMPHSMCGPQKETNGSSMTVLGDRCLAQGA